MENLVIIGTETQIQVPTLETPAAPAPKEIELLKICNEELVLSRITDVSWDGVSIMVTHTNKKKTLFSPDKYPTVNLQREVNKVFRQIKHRLTLKSITLA